MSQTLFPTLRFRDARASIDWLERVLGAEPVVVHVSEDGRHVEHAEVRIGETAFMCGDRPEGTATAVGASVLYVVVADADAAHARARDAGGDPTDPVDLDYGSRDFRVTDPDGNVWAIGTYAGAEAAQASG